MVRIFGGVEHGERAYSPLQVSHILNAPDGCLLLLVLIISLVEDIVAAYFQSLTSNSDVLLLIAFAVIPFAMIAMKAYAKSKQVPEGKADLSVDATSEIIQGLFFTWSAGWRAKAAWTFGAFATVQVAIICCVHCKMWHARQQVLSAADVQKLVRSPEFAYSLLKILVPLFAGLWTKLFMKCSPFDDLRSTYLLATAIWILTLDVEEQLKDQTIMQILHNGGVIHTVAGTDAHHASAIQILLGIPMIAIFFVYAVWSWQWADGAYKLVRVVHAPKMNNCSSLYESSYICPHEYATFLNSSCYERHLHQFEFDASVGSGKGSFDYLWTVWVQRWYISFTVWISIWKRFQLDNGQGGVNTYGLHRLRGLCNQHECHSRNHEHTDSIHSLR